MYSADTAADLVQEQLGKSKNQRDFLLVAVFHAVAVLKQFPGGSSGFIHQLQKFLVICLTNCLCCPFYTGSLFKEVDGTENCSVVLNLVYMCKQILKGSFMKKLCTKYLGCCLHLTWNLRVLLAEICMAFSCVYNYQSVTKFSIGEVQLAVFQIISVCKVEENRTTNCTCHLVHHSRSFIPVYVLCVLTNLCIVCVSHLAVVKEVIDDYADQHFKGCRGTYSCCCDYVGAYIGIKTSCLKAILLRTFHHTGNQGKGSLRIVGSADSVKINYDLISVAFTCDVDHVGSIWCSCADGIQIDTSCDYLAAVVVNMVSDDLCSSRGSKEICMVMFVDSGKVVCKTLETSCAGTVLSIDFLKVCFFW